MSEQDIFPNLTTTEELILEVATARKLLGHASWQFNTTTNGRANSVARAVASLQAKGLVEGEQEREGSIRVLLTSKGDSLGYDQERQFLSDLDGAVLEAAGSR